MKASLKEYNSLDILKFVLAIFVLVIHSEIDKTVISPLLRIAVPIFFVISGYLFFSKIQRFDNRKDELNALSHLVKRNLFLYVSWVVIQLPILVYGGHYHKNFFTKGLWLMLRDLSLGNAFTGSWYIIALAIGTVIIYFISRKLSAEWILLITLPIYLICCFATNYRGLFADDSWVVNFFESYEKITSCDFNTSFPGGLFWIALGNFLATKKDVVRSKGLYILFTLSAILIVAERILIVTFDLQYHDDCYFALILLCPCIFLLVKSIDKTFVSGFRFREMSTLIYVIHGTCGRVTGFALKKMPGGFWSSEVVKVIITICLAIFISFIILKIRDKYKFKALKYIC